MYRAILMRAARRLFLVAFIVSQAHVALAQTADPNFVEFDPSPDHSTLAGNGIALVQEYLLSLYVAGQGSAFRTITIGKPAADPDGKIRVDFLSLMASFGTPGVMYEARVMASGPGGIGPSLVSNQFQYMAACSTTVAPTTLATAPSSGSGNITVTTTAGCAWSATSEVAWLGISSGANGSGTGAVAFNILANTGPSARVGTLTIGGQTFTVTQAGTSCTYSISTTSQALATAGGSGSVTVTAPSACAWTASSNAPWLTVTSGAGGTGDGPVAFVASANTSTSERIAALMIAGQTVTVTQSAPASCTYGISAPGLPLFAPVAASGQSTYTWAESTSDARALQRVGSDRVMAAWYSAAFSIDVNLADTQPHEVAIYVADYDNGGRQQRFDILDASGTLLDSRTVSAFSGGQYVVWTVQGHVTIQVTRLSGPNAVVSAVLIGPGPAGGGAGSGVSTATFVKTDTTTQGDWKGVYGADGYSIVGDETSQALLTSTAGPGTVTVTAPTGCAWTASSNASWLTVTSGASGTGAGTVAFNASANTGTSARTATLTIAGQTFTVTQAGGASCSYSLSATSQAVTAAGGSGSVALTAPAGCTWTTTSSATWLTVASGASGSGTVAFSASANGATTARTATLTIGGQVFTVTQAGATSCSYSLSATSQAVTAAGGSGSVAVTSTTGCAWSTSSSATWLTVTSGVSGTGDGPVVFSILPNTSQSGRAATLTIGGQTFTVTQAAAASCSYAISAPALALNAPVVASGQSTYSWAEWTSDARALQRVGSDRVMAAWYNPAFSIDVTLADTQPHEVAIYLADYDNWGRQQRFDILDASGTLLDSRTVSDFSGGQYVVWTVQGHVTIQVTSLSGPNAVVSAVLIGPGPAGGGGAGSGVSTATFVKTDATTKGDWKGVYGAQGYAIVGDETSQPLTSAAGTGSVSVTSSSGCDWTASSNATWLTVTSGASGSGAGSVSFSVTANTGSSARTATLTIADQPVTITQPGVSCAYTISGTSQSLTAAAGTGSVMVTSPSGCGWTATSSATWLTMTSAASGTGAGTVAFSASANTSTSVRTATLTIAGQTFTVTQAGAASCSYTLSAASQALTAVGGLGSVTLTAPSGCAWTATSSATWLTVASGGSGGGTVAFTAQANTSTSARNATLTIAGQTFTVTQAGIPCGYAISPATTSVPSAGGPGSIAVMSSLGCTWTATSGAAAWLTVTSGATGSGDGSVGFSAAPNTGSTTRTGTLLIGGQTFTATQAGTSCSYVVAPLTRSMSSTAGTATVSITTGTGCSWSAASTFAWLTITSGSAGTGTGSVSFSASSNSTSSTRTGTMKIAGQDVTVTQSGTTACTITLAPTSRSVNLKKTTGTIIVTAAGCPWTAVSSAAWLTVTSAVTSQGTVSYTVARNVSGRTRTGTIVVGGVTFTLTQRTDILPNSPDGLRVVVGGD